MDTNSTNNNFRARAQAPGNDASAGVDFDSAGRAIGLSAPSSEFDYFETPEVVRASRAEALRPFFVRTGAASAANFVARLRHHEPVPSTPPPGVASPDWGAAIWAFKRDYPHVVGEDLLRRGLLESFADEGVNLDNVARVVWHCLHGAVRVGTCVACVVSAVVPAAVPAVVALSACDHALDALDAYKMLVSQERLYEPTAGEGQALEGVEALAGVVLGRLGIAAPAGDIVQLVAALLASASNPDSRAAAFSAIVAFIRTTLALQVDACDAFGMARALVSGYEPTAGCGVEFDDVVAALTRGFVPAEMPLWLGGALVLAGKLLGLSVAASMSDALVPRALVIFCKRANITPGALVDDVLAAVRDLLERSRAACAERDWKQLLTSIPRSNAMKEGARFLAMLSTQVPGEGHGMALIESRKRKFREVTDGVQRHWAALPPGHEKGDANRMLSLLEGKFVEHCDAWYSPNGRPIPLNFFLTGPSRTGKTLVQDILAEVVLKVLGLPYDKSCVFSISAGKRMFFDHYDSAIVKVICVDEVGSVVADKADAETYDILLRLMGENKFVVPMADVNQIGKQHARQAVTIITSNMPDAGTTGQLNYPAALMERFNCRLTVDVHDSARLAGGQAIDPAVVASATPDTKLWKGVCEEAYRPNPNGTVSWRVVARFESQADLIRVIAPRVRARMELNSSFAGGVDRRAGMVDAILAEQPVVHTAGESEPGVLPVASLNGTGWATCRVLAERAWCLSYGEALASGDDWERSARGACLWLGAALALWSWFACSVAVTLFCQAAVLRWIEAVRASAHGGPPAVGARRVENAVAWSIATIAGAWWLPFGVRLWYVDAASPALAALKAVRLDAAMKRLQDLELPVAAAVKVLCMGLAYWLVTKGPVWWRQRSGVVETTAAAGMSYDELRAKVASNPTGWQGELKVSPAVDDGVWREVAAANAARGPVSRKFLPLMEVGPEALQRSLVSGTYVALVSGYRGDGSGPIVRNVTAFSLGGVYFATAAHAFTGLSRVTLRLVAREFAEVGVCRKVAPMEEGVNWARVGSHDVVVFYLPVPPRPDGLKWLLPSAPLGTPGRGERVLVLRPIVGGTGLSWETASVVRPGVPGVWASGTTKYNFHACVLSVASVDGVSGAPCVLSTSGGTALMGLVSGNTDGAALVDVFTRSEVEVAVASLAVCGHYKSTAGLDYSMVPASTASSHERNWVNASDDVRAVVLGFLKGRVSYRLRWEPNPLVAVWPPLRAWARDAGAEGYAVPAMRSYHSVAKDGQGVWRDPFRKAMSSIRGDTLLPAEFPRMVVESYLSRLPAVMQDVSPLGYDEAVFGSKRCGAIDLRRSAGTMGGLKMNHVDVERQLLGARLRAAVEAVVVDIRAGTYKPARVNVVLKNELRPIDKAIEGARPICPGDFAVFIVQRAYLFPIVAAVLACGPQRSAVAIGVNAADPRQWGALHDYLAGASADGRVGDGDFGAFDSNEQIDLVFAEACIMAEVARRGGRSEEECRFVADLTFLTYFNVLTVDGTMLVRYQGRDSGEYATDFRNCIQCYGKLLAAYYLSAAAAGVTSPPSFDEAVRPLILGDDHVIGVREDARGFYHSESIAAVLEPYGDAYTNADKTVAASTTYKSLEEAVFLGRRWRRESGLWAAPLGLERCAKSYRAVLVKKAETRGLLAEAIVSNTLSELVMHGREAYEGFVAVLPRGPVVLGDGSTCAVSAKPYDVVLERWSRGALVTWDSGGQVFGADDHEPGGGTFEETCGEGVRVAVAVYGWGRLLWWVGMSLLLLLARCGAERSGGCFVPTSGEVVVTGEELAASADDHAATIVLSRADVTHVGTRTGDVVPVPDLGVQDDWLKRPVLVSTIAVTATSVNATLGAFAKLQLMQLWMANPAVMRKIANNRFLYGGVLRAHIQVGGTGFHRGALVVGTVPGSNSYQSGPSVGGVVNPNQLVQANGMVLNFKGPASYELDIPLTPVAGFVLLEQQTNGTCGIQDTPQLWFAILSPLTHCSLATAPPINVQVRVCLIAGELFSPTDVVAYTVTAGEKGAGRETSRPGMFSQAAQVASRAFTALAAFPPLAPFATPAAMVARGVGELASLFGFGRPTDRVAAVSMYLGANTDLGRAVGTDPVPIADLDPAASSSPYPGAGNFPAVDQMSIEFLGGKWALAAGSSNSAEWLTSSPVGTALFSIPVCPGLVDSGLDASAFFVLHPCMLLGLNYSMWRGSAVFKVVVFSGSLDAGRLRVYWVPGTGATTGSTLDNSQRYSALLDLADGTEVELRVDFHAGSNVLLMPLRFADLPATSYATTNYAGLTNNGVLRVEPDAPLVSGQSSTAVALKVFVRWEGLKFYHQTDRMLNTVMFTAGESMVPEVGSLQDVIYNTSSVGVHLRPVLQKYHLERQIKPVKFASTDTTGSWAGSYSAFGYAGEGSFTGGDPRWHTIIDLCHRCYHVFRGTFKHRVLVGAVPDGTVFRGFWAAAHGFAAVVPGVGGPATWALGTAAAAGAAVPPVVMETLSSLSALDYSGTSVVKAEDGALWGVAVPWHSVMPWHGTGQEAAGGAGSRGGLPSAGTSTTITDPVVQFGFSFSGAPAVAANWSLLKFVACGDDVVWNGFVFMPVVSAKTWPA